MPRPVLLACACVASLAGTPGMTADPSAPPAYPQTRREARVETQFGVPVADPYRWLENDVRSDAEVARWVADQNRLSAAYLAALPGRDALARRMKALYDYERRGVPRGRGGRLFYTKNSGLQNQSPLYTSARDGSGERLLLDPNSLSADGATALAEWEPSDDGRHVVYAVQDGGTDWRILSVIDVATGATLPDRVEWVKFSNLSWGADGRGFYYSRFDAPPGSAKFQATVDRQQIWYHALGTAQSADRLIYATPDRPSLNHSAEVTDDGRWLLVTSAEGTDERYILTLVPLVGQATEAAAGPVTLVPTLANDWALAGSEGDTLYFRTDLAAPRGRLVRLDAAHPAAPPVELVAEGRDTLVGASLIGGRFVLDYLSDAKSRALLVERDGRPVGEVPLPGIGTVMGFAREKGSAESFFGFTSYTDPTRIYRYDSASNSAQVCTTPALAFDPAAFESRQVFYPSRDGTKVPMLVVRRRDLGDRPGPTLLYGYGGFNVPVLPAFAPARLAWLEAGGTLAVANLRGGGEYGKAWHDAGRLAAKQTVFDDFIAAAEYLKGQGIATRIAIEGRSNGGLLVGAVVNQRPDLFAAALPGVGVMDMLRFDRFTAGKYWVDDYGYPSREADFRTLLAYSPYHRIRGGADYPAILVTTADTDDRVVPGHSFKYTAALQHAALGDRPHLIRIETRAGHGSGKPVDKTIAEFADMYAFAAYWTGLDLASSPPPR